MGDSLENQDVSLDAQNAVIVDYGAFANYLRKAATILLPENNNDDNYPPAVSCTTLNILLNCRLLQTLTIIVKFFIFKPNTFHKMARSV